MRAAFVCQGCENATRGFAQLSGLVLPSVALRYPTHWAGCSPPLAARPDADGFGIHGHLRQQAQRGSGRRQDNGSPNASADRALIRRVAA
jgi:hypothetical protein